jgi:hypothetical protein
VFVDHQYRHPGRQNLSFVSQLLSHKSGTVRIDVGVLLVKRHGLQLLFGNLKGRFGVLQLLQGGYAVCVQIRQSLIVPTSLFQPELSLPFSGFDFGQLQTGQQLPPAKRLSLPNIDFINNSPNFEAVQGFIFSANQARGINAQFLRIA